MDIEFLQDYDLGKLKQFIEKHMESCKYIIEAGWCSGEHRKFEEEQYQLYSEVLEILYILDKELLENGTK